MINFDHCSPDCGIVWEGAKGAVFLGELNYADETDAYNEECEDRGFVVPFRLAVGKL